ncbi:MAG: class I SAM-dependent RNA methyltransferase [Clostridia bacterium]|nr:class I SAM-dependent RNA methyltransferase [Clostridia bacterium]
MEELNLIATTTFGLEAVLNRELEALGVKEYRTMNGRTRFKGDVRMLAKANLWLRTADRILLNMGEFKALTFEELFQGVKKIPWENLLGKDAAFIVNARSVKSKIYSLRDIQAISKKAIAERLKKVYSCDWLNETGARYMIEVAFLEDNVTVTVDTSGHGLNKRGYRQEVGKSPIKETLAAGLIMVSRWHPDRPFMDPFCGSGTFGIEAAMIGMNIAPGLKAEFDAEKWEGFSPEIWEEERVNAIKAINRDARLRIYCSDVDYFQVKLAEKHAELAGVQGHIYFQKIDFAEAGSRYDYGFIITNPPYGERLLEKKEAEEIYRGMGKHFPEAFPTWSVYVITSCEQFETLYGRKADKKRKIFNGGLKCNYYQFFGPVPPKPKTLPTEEPGKENEKP